MKKQWTVMLLALALCTAETIPAMALEDTAIVPMADDAEEADARTDAEIIEDTLLPAEGEAGANASPAKSEVPDTGLSETVSIDSEENDLVIDLSDESDDLEVSPAADVWSASPAADEDAQAEISLDAEHFPDDAFRSCLGKFDEDKSSGLSAEEIAAVTEIDVIGKNVSDLTGLSYFTGLESLLCDNNSLTSLDVSGNTSLKYLTCTNNSLTALDLTNNAALFSLVCSGNQLETLDLSRNPKLQDLRCAGNKLKALEIGKNMSLAWLDCSQNSLTALNASEHKSLCYLWCSGNQLSDLNVSGDAKLQWLDCSDNQLTELNVTDVLNVDNSSDSAVNILNCANNRLTSLDVSGKDYFKGLICSGNELSELDLTTDPDLRQLECADNALISLDVTKNEKLQTLDCSGNQIVQLDLRSLSISQTTVLPDCSGQQLVITPEKTENGSQIDIKKLLGGDCSIVRMTREEYEKNAGAEKSTLGNVILLSQEDDLQDSELQDGVLTFAQGHVPETIELFCATGYQKKAGEQDVLLELCLIHKHDYQPAGRTEPTCTEDGISLEKCSGCGDELTETLPATGHRYQIMETAPTCTEDGARWAACEVCGAEKEGSRQTIPAAGHRYQTMETTPTCTEDGARWETCEVCGAEKEGSRQTIPAGHAYGAYTVVREATIFEPGIQRRVCSACGNVQEESVPKLNGTVALTDSRMPIQIDQSVSVQSLVTGLQEGDCVTSWTSDNPEIAAVSGDGTITAKKTGNVNITVATKSGATAVIAVSVQVDPVLTAGIQGLSKKLTVAVGGRLRLRPSLTPISSRQKITYKSSRKKIAKVSAKGVIKGLRKGTAKITVKSGKQKFTVKVKVTAPEIQNILAKKTLQKGTTFQLKPRLVSIGGSGVTWHSSDQKVASVTADGKIKAKKEGTARITVTAGKAQAVCKVVVVG